MSQWLSRRPLTKSVFSIHSTTTSYAAAAASSLPLSTTKGIFSTVTHFNFLGTQMGHALFFYYFSYLGFSNIIVF